MSDVTLIILYNVFQVYTVKQFFRSVALLHVKMEGRATTLTLTTDVTASLDTPDKIARSGITVLNSVADNSFYKFSIPISFTELPLHHYYWLETAGSNYIGSSRTCDISSDKNVKHSVHQMGRFWFVKTPNNALNHDYDKIEFLNW